MNFRTIVLAAAATLLVAGCSDGSRYTTEELKRFIADYFVDNDFSANQAKTIANSCGKYKVLMFPDSMVRIFVLSCGSSFSGTGFTLVMNEKGEMNESNINFEELKSYF